MTNIEFINHLKNIANRKTGYNNHYPYNCCYYDGDKMTSDCYCLIKSVFWDENIDQNYTTGKFAVPKVNVFPDYTIFQMIDMCTYVSEDFSDLNAIPKGAILKYDISLGHGGHAGVYIGDGKVVETTTAWEGGTVISDIGTDGTRSKNDVKSGRWSHWGTLPQLEYIVNEKTGGLAEETIENEISYSDEENNSETDSFEDVTEIEVVDMWNKEDWKDILERTLYTACESLIGAIGGAALISEVNWVEVASIVGIATLVTFIKCLMTKIKN